MSGDCAMVLHWTTCCTVVAWGINQSFVAAFDQEESARDATCPGCGCYPQTLDETGLPAPTSDTSLCTFGSCFTVTCDQGQCVSHAPSLDQ